MLATALFFTTCTKDACELTSDDMDWLLEEYDSLYYLKNGTDTVVANVISGFGQSEYDWEFGIRTGDNNHYGYSKIDFQLKKDVIHFRYWIRACKQKIHIEMIKHNNDNIIYSFDYYSLKDSISNSNITIQEKEYENYFYFNSIEDTVMKEFLFSKRYGIIKFQTHQNELFELLPLNLEQ